MKKVRQAKETVSEALGCAVLAFVRLFVLALFLFALVYGGVRVYRYDRWCAEVEDPASPGNLDAPTP